MMGVGVGVGVEVGVGMIGRGVGVGVGRICCWTLVARTMGCICGRGVGVGGGAGAAHPKLKTITNIKHTILAIFLLVKGHQNLTSSTLA